MTECQFLNCPFLPNPDGAWVATCDHCHETVGERRARMLQERSARNVPTATLNSKPDEVLFVQADKIVGRIYNLDFGNPR